MWGEQELVVARYEAHGEVNRGDYHGKAEGGRVVEELCSVSGSNREDKGTGVKTGIRLIMKTSMNFSNNGQTPSQAMEMDKRRYILRSQRGRDGRTWRQVEYGI